MEECIPINVLKRVFAIDEEWAVEPMIGERHKGSSTRAKLFLATTS
jgi:hypothetical protein